ncbi:MAG: DNA-3-methyladenine glycosylase family protein [Christensenellales bacterium]|jgi:DNA-3-methyladenine glycosylase II
MLHTEAQKKKGGVIRVDHTQYFEYTENEITYLKSKDTALGKAMDEIGHVYREVIPNMFMALVNAIIGQQISTKAQETVWARFQTMFAPITPEHIGDMAVETIQSCGISMRKAAYIREIADDIRSGRLDLETLQSMSDADVCKRLSQIRGVGVWTAEMLMIFSMQRMDVLSRDDMAIARGLRMLYHHREITPKLFEKYRRRYSPYATVASLYLWQIAHGVCEGLVDHAPKKSAKKK